VHLLFITVSQFIGIEDGLYLKIQFDIAGGSLMKRIEALWPQFLEFG
jgi:hypothetical protein